MIFCQNLLQFDLVVDKLDFYLKSGFKRLKFFYITDLKYTKIFKILIKTNII